jgi:uncharacterized protein YbaR (Trm112 family)/SAM-dependent methyltransferase
MHTYLLEMLQCPACQGELAWRILEQAADRIVTAKTHCQVCSADYPVREGIGLFLTPDLPRNDLWDQVDSELSQYLHRHPDIKRQLLDSPLHDLAPADRFFRAMILEDQGHYSEAQEVEDVANEGLYTPAYMDCRNSQLDFVINWLSTTDGPIVDLASGRGYLAFKVVRDLDRHVVVTDFSPSLLRRDRRWLESFGLYDRVSLLAFDARRTPFKDGAVGLLTTNLGLPNVEEPGDLLKEVRRIVDGVFLAISNFYPEDDEANGKVIREAGMEKSLYRRQVLEQFADAGWEVEVKNVCVGEARPTPAGVLLEGARIDGLPVADTDLEWCVLLGTGQLVT